MLESINTVLAEAMPTVLAILVPVVILTVRRLVQGQTAKLDAEAAAAIEGALVGIVEQGVNYAEQWATTRKKSGEGNPESNQKLAQATRYIMEQAKARKLDVLAGASLEKKIESVLGSKKG